MPFTKSFTSEEEEKSFQQNFMSEDGNYHAGRSYHGVESSAYWLPRDEEEQLRLTGVCVYDCNHNKTDNSEYIYIFFFYCSLILLQKKHLAGKCLYLHHITCPLNPNRNYQREVDNYISFRDGVDCLDIGCGPGTFVMDMASEYPNSNFVGVDISAMVNVSFKLPNVSFSLGNVVEGLNFPDNSFDYIQLRIFVNALRTEEWPIVLKEVYRLLKPGGCLGSYEHEPRVCNYNILEHSIRFNI
jgi:SAM-dependent methyltransferase